MLQYRYRSLRGGKMTAKSSQPQKSKQEKKSHIFWGNFKKQHLKELRRRSKGGNNFKHSGCPGCEYCTNRKRDILSRKILDREIADYKLTYC